MRSRHVTLWIAWAVVRLTVADEPEFLVDAGKESHDVRADVVTPHTPWLHPYARGRLRVLLIGPRFGIREGVELAQRLSMDFHAVVADSSERLGSWDIVVGRSHGDLVRELQAGLERDLDLIVIGNVKWDAFGKELLFQLFQKVRKGCGLLYCGRFDDPRFLPLMLERVPDEDTEPVRKSVSLKAMETPLQSYKESPAQFYRLGRGRVVLCRMGQPGAISMMTDAPPDRLRYEMAQAFVIQLALWAANQEPRIHCAFTEPASLTPWGDAVLPQTSIEVTNRSGQPMDLRLHCKVCDELGRTEVDERRPVVLPAQGASRVVVPLKRLGIGRHWISTWAESQEGQENFATALIDVIASGREPQIQSLKLDRPWYRRTDTAALTITLNMPSPDPLALSLRMVDVWDRVLALKRADLNAGARSCDLAIPLADLVFTWNQIQVDLLTSRGEPIHRQDIELLAPDREIGNFVLAGWGAATGGHMGQVLGRAMWEMGADGGVWCYHPRGILRGVIFAGRFITGGKVDREGVRTPCLNDPVYRETVRGEILKRTKSFANYGTLGYSLGDEPSSGGGCTCEHCLRGFREWLQARFPDVMALNREWGSTFPSWTDVKPSLNPEQAIKSGSLGSWLDHRIYMDQVVADYFAFEQECIRETDPTARAGPEGLHPMGPYQGTDWYDLSKKCRMLGPYMTPGDMLQYETIRSFSTDPGDFRYGIFGSYRDMVSHEWLHRSLPWLALVHGQNGLLWFSDFRVASSATDSLSGLAPDFRPSCSYRWALEEIQRIQSGIYHIMRNSERQHDGIGVLFSRPSLYAANLRSFNLMANAIQECGFQYRVMDARELDQGRLNDGTFRAFFLPSVIGLSDRGAAEVARFISQGGVTVADLLPGLMTDHGRMREVNPLDDAFGVNSRGLGKLPEAHASEFRLKEVPATSRPTLRLTMPGNVERLSTGTALGEMTDQHVPAAIVNRCGKGRSLLLNFALLDTGTDGWLNWEGQAEGYRDLLRNALLQGNLTPSVTLADAGTGQRIERGVEIVRYRSGSSEYVTILLARLRDSETPRQAEIRFPEARFLYDVPGGKFLGHGPTVSLAVQPGPAQFIARLPFRVEGVNLKTAPRAMAGQPMSYTWEVATNPATDDPQVIRIHVIHPSGQDLRHYRCVFVSQTNAGTGTVPFAISDTPGTWRLRAVHVASGVAAETTFDLDRPSETP